MYGVSIFSHAINYCSVHHNGQFRGSVYPEDNFLNGGRETDASSHDVVVVLRIWPIIFSLCYYDDVVVLIIWLIIFSLCYCPAKAFLRICSDYFFTMLLRCCSGFKNSALAWLANTLPQNPSPLPLGNGSSWMP